MNPRDAQRLVSHAESLRQLARALVGDGQAADDLVQETYLTALAKGESPERGWLRGVLRNKNRERRRADARRARREDASRPPSAGPGPHETAQRIDEQRALMDAFARVPEPFRTALWMRYFAGQTPGQIAKALDVPAATVRTRIHRGLESLRAELDQTHGDRRSWQLMLLPLMPSTGTAGALGALMAWTKSKIVAGAAAVALLVGGTLAALHVMDIESSSAPPDPETPIDLAHENAPTSAAEDAPPLLVGRSDPDVGNAAAGAMPDDSENPPSASTAAVIVRGRVRLKDDPLEWQPKVYVIAKDAEPTTQPVAKVTCEVETGRFELGVDEIRGHWIVAAPPASTGYLRMFLDGDRWDGEPIDVLLERGPERVIRVVGPDGEGVQAHLAILPEQVGAIRTWPRPEDEDLGMWTRSTDEDGVMKVRLPTRRPFVVHAKAPDLVAEPVRVAADALEVEIRLEMSAIVRVTPEGWKQGDMPLTGRLVRTDAAHEVRPLYAGAQLDGTIVFSDGVLPGDYTVHLTSPNHEDAVLEGVRVLNAADTVHVTVPVRRNARAGTLRLVVTQDGMPLRDGSEVLLLWRCHAKGEGTWTNRGFQTIANGAIEMTGLAEGRHDLYVAHRAKGLRAGMHIGAWVQADEIEAVRLAMAPATMRIMSDLDDVKDVGSWTLENEDGTELPLFFLSKYGAQSYASPRLPPLRTELGPYPEGAVTLRIEEKEGAKRTFSLARAP